MLSKNRVSYIKSAWVTFVGLLFTQGLNLVGSIAIARLFTPSDFGVFVNWLAIASTLAVLITWRMELAIVSIEEINERAEALGFVLFAIVISMLLITIGAVIIYLATNLLVEIDILHVFSLIVASGLTATNQLWQSWVVSNGKYYQLSVNRVVISGSLLVFQLILGFVYSSAAALMAGYVAGVFMGLMFSFKIISMPVFLKWQWSLFRIRFACFISKQRNFIMFSLPADAVSLIAASIPLVIVLNKFGAAEAGVFGMVVRILSGPIGLVGAAVLDIFKRQASISFNLRKNCRDEYLFTFKILLVISAFVVLFVITYFEVFISFFYGAAWREAAEIALLLLPMFAVKLIASPLSFVLYIVKKQSVDLLWQLALLLISVVSIMSMDTFQDAIRIYAISCAGAYVIYIFVSYKFSAGDSVE